MLGRRGGGYFRPQRKKKQDSDLFPLSAPPRAPPRGERKTREAKLLARRCHLGTSGRQASPASRANLHGPTATAGSSIRSRGCYDSMRIGEHLKGKGYR